MILYLDTSALVKLYSIEAGSTLVRELIGEADLVATSLLSYAETRSALGRKARTGDIGDAALKRSKQAFERDWLRLVRLPIDEVSVLKAGDLCEEHALQAFDALHLAAAETLKYLIRAAVTFACFDRALNLAARSRGFETPGLLRR